MATVRAGETAFPFRLKNDKGESVALADFRGKSVVLWFFVKALTPG